MIDNSVLLWWQNRYPQWASVTAPLVRHFVHDAVQSVPLKTVLRLSFVRSLWRDEPVRLSNASSRLSNIYDCSAATIIEDLQRIGNQPLREFVQRYPTQAQVSQATFSLFSAPSQQVIQEVVEFDQQLTEYHRANEAEIREAIALVEATCPILQLDDTTKKLTAKKEDELCFQWSHYLAIADGLEPERRKLMKFVKPDQAPPPLMAEKCRQFYSRLKELLEYTRKNKPPQVMRSWLDEVEAWVQTSALAFPDYRSATQARTAKKQKAVVQFEQLLDEPSRQRLASIGEFTLEDEGRFGLKVSYKKLKELSCGWAPMTLQLIFDRSTKSLEFTESDKVAVFNALHRFTTDIGALKASALEYARDMSFELLRKGKWVSAKDLTDEQLAKSVKKLTIQVFHPRPSEEEVMATLELDCDWDLEHGVRFGLMSNGQVILQP